MGLDAQEILKKYFDIPYGDRVVGESKIQNISNKNFDNSNNFPADKVVSPSDLSNYALISALNNYALLSTLNDYALKTDLNAYVQSNDPKLSDSRISKSLYKVVTPLEVSNTVQETDLLSATIPANTLGTDNIIRIFLSGLFLNNTAATSTSYYIRVYYGTTKIYEDRSATIPVGGTDSYPFTMDINLFAKGSANAQGLGGYVLFGNIGSANAGYGNLATDEILSTTPLVGIQNSAEDSEIDKILRVAILLVDADSNIKFTRLMGYYQVIN